MPVGLAESTVCRLTRGAALRHATCRGSPAAVLTVNLKGGDYLPRIFGPAGHVILHRVDLLLRGIRGVFRR